MTRFIVPRNVFLISALGIACAVLLIGVAAAQQPTTDTPEPKMPPMPSMEGQQGDISKPITQIPPRKKTAAEKKAVPQAPRRAVAPKKAVRKKR